MKTEKNIGTIAFRFRQVLLYIYIKEKRKSKIRKKKERKKEGTAHIWLKRQGTALLKHLT